MKPINFVYTSVIGVVIHNILTLNGAPQLSFGDGGTDDSDQKTISNGQQTGSSSGSGQLQTDNKIFFGNNNNNLNNILLGAAVGVGGVLVAQEIINGGNNQCNCGGPSRRRRQIQLQQDQDQQDDGQQKIFGFGGGNNCNCNTPASVEFGPDCKGRLEGNQYYGCGCDNNPAGGLFTFGRRRRRRQINTPTSTSSSQEDVDNRFLNFRCIGAALSGRNQQQNQNSQ